LQLALLCFLLEVFESVDHLLARRFLHISEHLKVGRVQAMRMSRWRRACAAGGWKLGPSSRRLCALFQPWPSFSPSWHHPLRPDPAPSSSLHLPKMMVGGDMMGWWGAGMPDAPDAPIGSNTPDFAAMNSKSRPLPNRFMRHYMHSIVRGKAGAGALNRHLTRHGGRGVPVSGSVLQG
jgi:hypothetical protein